MSLIQAAASSRLQKSQQSQAERRTQRSFAENWDTQTTPIVGGYRVIRKVGGGGFSQVYSAINRDGVFAAVKVILLDDGGRTSPEAMDKRIMREVRVHETLKHPNILELLSHEGDDRRHGSRQDWNGVGPSYYIVMEYAINGDLFDRIAPDFGVDEDIAHCFFVQLVNGLRFIHKNGICHRDIKPENILLGQNGNLKITDFGLCSVFKYKGQERLLHDACGSPPYAAPELALGKPYKAEPIDVWSAGIVLFTLLVGNTPWDLPTMGSPEYTAYTTGELLKYDPWTRIGPDAMSLLLQLLCTDPAKRIALRDAQRHSWLKRPNLYLNAHGLCEVPKLLLGALARNLAAHGHIDEPTIESRGTQIFVQPPSSPTDVLQNLGNMDTDTQSQSSRRHLPPPLPMMTMPSLVICTSASRLAPSQRGLPNLTYFVSHHPPATLLQHLLVILQQWGAKTVQGPLWLTDICHGDPVPGGDGGMIHLGIADRRKQPLKGVVVVKREMMDGDDAVDDVMEIDQDLVDPDATIRLDVNGGRTTTSNKLYLVSMRRAKGCTLEWRALYQKVLQHLPAEMVVAK